MLAVRQCRVMTGGPPADVYDPADGGRFVVSPWAFRLGPGTRHAFAALVEEVLPLAACALDLKPIYSVLHCR